MARGVSVKVNLSQIRADIARLEKELRAAARDSAQRAAEECAEMLNQRDDDPSDFIDRRLRSVFIPVQLKGQRAITTVYGHRLAQPVYVPTKELWPNLDPIYHVRVTQGRRTYQGRKRFWVDHVKEEALHDRLVREAKAAAQSRRYQVRVRPTSTGYVAEVLREGPRRPLRPFERRAVLIAAAKFRRYSAQELTNAIRQAGL